MASPPVKRQMPAKSPGEPDGGRHLVIWRSERVDGPLRPVNQLTSQRINQRRDAEKLQAAGGGEAPSVQGWEDGSTDSRVNPSTSAQDRRQGRPVSH